MKLVVVGTDADGRSSVVASQIVEGHAEPVGGGFAVEQLRASGVHPEALPPGATDREVADVGVPPGGDVWLRVTAEPGAHYGMHRSHSVDYDVVIAGELTLELEDGAITLHPGDAVLLTGQVHGWRSGPEGCTYAVVLTDARPDGEGLAP